MGVVLTASWLCISDVLSLGYVRMILHKRSPAKNAAPLRWHGVKNSPNKHHHVPAWTLNRSAEQPRKAIDMTSCGTSVRGTFCCALWRNLTRGVEGMGGVASSAFLCCIWLLSRAAPLNTEMLWKHGRTGSICSFALFRCLNGTAHERLDCPRSRMVRLRIMFG